MRKSWEYEEAIGQTQHGEKASLRQAAFWYQECAFILYPGIDAKLKEVVVQTVLPNIFQLGNGKGLELAQPTTSDEEASKPEEK